MVAELVAAANANPGTASVIANAVVSGVVALVAVRKEWRKEARAEARKAAREEVARHLEACPARVEFSTSQGGE